MADLVDRLERAMRRHMLAAMPPDPTARASSESLHSLLIDYAAWRMRVPIAVPRTVLISREFWQNQARSSYADGLAATIKEIALGQDLRPRLSTAILHAHELLAPPYMTRRFGRQRKDRDLLLSDWGIHHLHLGTERGRHPDFVRRGKHVLFVAFRGSIAYVIDLRAHEPEDNWAELRILETAVRNWPEAEIVYGMEGVRLVGGNITDRDRRALREFGVNTGIEIDGRAYFSLGQTTDGTPMQATRHAMKVSWTLTGVRDDPEEPQRTLRERAERWSLDPSGWRPVVHREEFGFANGGFFVPYGSLVP